LGEAFLGGIFKWASLACHVSADPRLGAFTHGKRFAGTGDKHHSSRLYFANRNRLTVGAQVNLSLAIDAAIDPAAFFGHGDRNLKLLRELLDVHLSARNDALRISGEPANVSRAAAVVAELQRYLRHHPSVDRDQLVSIVRRTEAEITGDATAAGPDEHGALDVTARGQLVHAKTEGQKAYLNAISHNDLVFCEGPAGTGKTFLAVAMAVSLLRRSIIRRIVLVRPAVEAGEKLGFLPGGIEEKVNPYLRPLLDALSDMMTFEQIRRYMANDVIEVAPLAYMRGRTLNEAVVILDEAQNTTPSQMMMFLTRLGERSKMIVTGDSSQVDLERGQDSGLIDAHRTLRGIKGIAFVTLDKGDIVRHRLVQNIVQAYADRNSPRA